MFRENREPDQIRDDSASALLYPHEGTSDSALVAWLSERGATDVACLAPGFISATATIALFDEAKDRAEVEVKPHKRFHTS